MFLKNDLFSGELGKTERPLASRFMTIPLTREIKLKDILYVVEDLYLPASDEILTCSLNGSLIMAGDDEYIDIVRLAYDPVDGLFKKSGGYSWGRQITVPEGTFNESPIARGIDWILTHRYILRVFPNGNAMMIQVSWSLNDIYISRDPYCLVTPHRNRGFAKGIPGGGHDPFTGAPMEGTLPWAENSITIGWAHKITGHDGAFAGWPRKIPRFGDNILVDGFVVEMMADTSHYDETEEVNGEEAATMTSYHGVYRGIRPVTPLEFHAIGDEGRPVSALDVRVAASKNGLYARGMMTMGKACLIPSAFGKAGYPTEYFLFISNSHGYQGPYDPFDGTILTRDDIWENTSPMVLKDVNDPTQDFLAGYTVRDDDPLSGAGCGFPMAGGVLLPDGNRYSEDKDIFYDPKSRIGLMLDDQGAFFFGGDIANNTISTLDDYKCATMADWLAPGREVEALSLAQVISSIGGGTLITDIERDFVRDVIRGLDHGILWGAFEKKQDVNDPDLVTGRVRTSLVCGTDPVYPSYKNILGTDLPAPDDVEAGPFDEIPVENVIKDPFSLSVLDYDYNSIWEDVDDNCVLSRTGTSGQRIYGTIDPDTGNITESNSAGGIPSGWSNSGLFGLAPNGVIYPFPSIGDKCFFADTFQAYRRRFMMLGGTAGMIALVESSSGTRIAWRHPAFGQIEINSSGNNYDDRGLVEMVRPAAYSSQTSDTVERYRLNVVLDNAPLPAQFSKMRHLGKDYVTTWNNNRKSLKTLTVWLVKGQGIPEGETTPIQVTRFTNYLCIMRTDLDPSVFDFDEEMRKVSGNV